MNQLFEKSSNELPPTPPSEEGGNVPTIESNNYESQIIHDTDRPTYKVEKEKKSVFSQVVYVILVLVIYNVLAFLLAGLIQLSSNDLLRVDDNSFGSPLTFYGSAIVVFVAGSVTLLLFRKKLNSTVLIVLITLVCYTVFTSIRAGVASY